MITLFPGTGGENEKSKTVKKPNNNKNKCQIYSGKTSEKKNEKNQSSSSSCCYYCPINNFDL